MRKLLPLLLLVTAWSCKKEHEPAPQLQTLKKIEWHLHVAEDWTEPWLDSMTAGVTVRVYKTDTIRHTSVTVWDTSFAPRIICQYPTLPQKHIIEKQVAVLPEEKLQAWYNIRYERAGSVSENIQSDSIQKPFTFIDIKL